MRSATFPRWSLLAAILFAALVPLAGEDRRPVVMSDTGRPITLPTADRLALPSAGPFLTALAPTATANRVITLPDATTTLAGYSVAGTWTAAQNFGTGTTVIATIDANAGAIDGTAIGAASASTGAFTTLSASGTLTVTGSGVSSFAGVLDVTEALRIDRASGNPYFAFRRATVTAGFVRSTDVGTIAIENESASAHATFATAGITLSRNVTLASGINLAMSGASTFASGTGPSTFNGQVTIGSSAPTTVGATQIVMGGGRIRAESSQQFTRASGGAGWYAEDSAVADGSRPFVYLRNVSGTSSIGTSNRSAGTQNTTSSIDAITFTGSAVTLALPTTVSGNLTLSSGSNLAMSGAATATFGTGTTTFNGLINHVGVNTASGSTASRLVYFGGTSGDGAAFELRGSTFAGSPDTGFFRVGGTYIGNWSTAGLTLTSGALTVASDTDATTILGRARIHSPATDIVYFSHFDRTTASNYAMRQDAVGGTSVNAASGQSLALRNNNSIVATVSATEFALAEGINLSAGTTTGSKIGGATTQKLGFWNATPVVQPTAVADASGGATVDAEARAAINDLLARMRTIGLIAP